MATKKIEQWEVERYWEIFSSILPAGASHLDGSQAATVLKNSQLRDDQLERVWDLADVDNDGRLDFEEFCVAMRIVFDLVNGEYVDVPTSLPDWLVPESKAHLVQATRALRGGPGSSFERPQDFDDDEHGGLKDGFDWYMTPSQKAQYEDIYSSARDGHGYVEFTALVDLYASMSDSVPDTDVRSAWNLVNPSADEVIGKDACLAFLHVLRARHDGYRLPRNVPASLRATFDKHDVDYNVERTRSAAAASASKRGTYDESTSMGRKSKFGDAYLSRLGTGASKPRGTDFSTAAPTTDWEEVRLKKQLRELENKIDTIETAQKRREQNGGRRSESKPALVKRELEQLLDYKRRELRGLESGDSRDLKESQALKGVEEDIKIVKEQVDGLAAHLKTREEVLQDLKRQIQEEKGR